MKPEIVHIALENLKETTSINAIWLPGNSLDGIIKFDFDGNTFVCPIEIKKELRQYQLPQIESQHQKHKNFIVVAETIFPKLKKQLRELGIAYLEVNGNIFMKTHHIYLFIEANKPFKIQKQKSNRAFTKTGLKVLMQFLMNPSLINQTHREIADKAMVGLGNIPQIIEGLKETGFIIAVDKHNYIWENQEELLNRWVNDYAAELRPKTVKGTYKVPETWNTIKLNNETTVWGGESASDILTNYLRPEKHLLHSKESNINLIKNYKLIPDQDGKLEVLDMFWNNQEKQETAPPIIIYAELMLEGGKRNKEVATLIFNEFIEPKL